MPSWGQRLNWLRHSSAPFLRSIRASSPRKPSGEHSNNPPRIAYGGPEQATKILDRLYEEFPGSPRDASSSFEAVELLKYVENTIDTVLISLWNEYLAYADAIGLDRAYFVELCSAIIERDRFATTLRVPGGAFGKWCLPKDLKALLQSFEQHGVDAQVLEGADATNDSVVATVGENPVPTRNLLNLADGRTRLAPVAQDFLLKLQHPCREAARVDEKDRPKTWRDFLVQTSAQVAGGAVLAILIASLPYLVSQFSVVTTVVALGALGFGTSVVAFVFGFKRRHRLARQLMPTESVPITHDAQSPSSPFLLNLPIIGRDVEINIDLSLAMRADHEVRIGFGDLNARREGARPHVVL